MLYEENTSVTQWLTSSRFPFHMITQNQYYGILNMYNAFIIKWITQAVSSGYSCTHTMCGCVCTCEMMSKKGYFTFTVAEKRWVGRESQTLFLGQLQFSLSFWDTQHTYAHTHTRMPILRATTAGHPHFPVNVLFQLKLWHVGFLHGPVLQLSDRGKKRQSRPCSHAANR